MSDMKHAPEPWIVQNGDPNNPTTQPSNIYSEFLSTTDGHKYIDDSVALFMKEANAQRIVDCVNAMAGIEDVEGFMDLVKDAIRFGECYEYHTCCKNAPIIKLEWCGHCRLRELDLFPDKPTSPP